jgi:transposase
VTPATDERFFLELPYLKANMFFMDAFAQAFPDSLNILLLDNSGAHTSRRLRWPDHLRAVWLPPYGPELNPIERLWRDLKDALAWQPFVDLDTQQLSVADLLQAYDAPTLQALTGYTDLLERLRRRRGRGALLHHLPQGRIPGERRVFLHGCLDAIPHIPRDRDRLLA